MKLAYWMYAGPAHIGTLRIASSFNNVHAIMHAPLGDDYFVWSVGFKGPSLNFKDNFISIVSEILTSIMVGWFFSLI